MGKFYDHVEALKGIEGDYPGEIVNGLVGAYDEEMLEHVGTLDAANLRISELESEMAAAIAAKDLEITEIKAAKFDEIMSTPVNTDDESDDEDTDSLDEDDLNDDSGSAIDKLFK